MLLQMALFRSFLWLSNNIPLYIYHIFFIHSSVDGHLGWFRVLAIVNIVLISLRTVSALSEVVSLEFYTKWAQELYL